MKEFKLSKLIKTKFFWLIVVGIFIAVFSIVYEWNENIFRAYFLITIIGAWFLEKVKK